MTRRTLAPSLLLITAVCAVAAVFAVHRIERGVGPFALPYATRFFAPLSSGDHATATVRFATKRVEYVTVRITRDDGRVVRTLLDDARVRPGGTVLHWDGRDEHGTLQPDGRYAVRITRRGDSRTYAPVDHIRLDATLPHGWLENVGYAHGELTALVVFDPDSNVVVEDGSGHRLPNIRRWFPKPGTVSGTPERTPFAGAKVIRFAIPVDASSTPLATIRVVLADQAGNEVDITNHQLATLGSSRAVEPLS